MSAPRMPWVAEDSASKAVLDLARKVAETFESEPQPARHAPAGCAAQDLGKQLRCRCGRQ